MTAYEFESEIGSHVIPAQAGIQPIRHWNAETLKLANCRSFRNLAPPYVMLLESATSLEVQHC
jgi:hypothetical protein